MPVRVLFLTMLAIKEPDHVVRMPFRRLCKKANMTPEVCTEALRVLLEPDTKSIDHQEFEGRRLKEVEGGWMVLNGEYYRREMQKLMLRFRKTEWQRNARAKDKVWGKPLPGEVAALKHEGNGDHAAADRVTSAALPAPRPVAAVPAPAPVAAPVPLAPTPQPAAAATPEPEPEPKRKLYTMDEIKRMTEAQRAQAQQRVIPGKGLFTP